MKKALLTFIFILILLSSAYADEPLMWASLNDPVIHSSDDFLKNQPQYVNPKQYQLKLRSLAVTVPPDDLLSDKYTTVQSLQDNHDLIITSSHSYFPFAPNHYAAAFPGTDNLPVDLCLSDDTPVITKLQQFLKSTGWADICAPDMFCTAAQVVSRGTNPLENGEYYTAGILEELWNNLYFVHFMQKIDGYPLDIWIEDATEDEYETRDASFVLDDNGKIITGCIFPGYEIVRQADLPGKLLSAEEAGQRFLNVMKDRFAEYKTLDGFQHYSYSWEIVSFEPGLVLTHNDIALPNWQILYQLIVTDENTGEQFRNYRTYSINALTGI